jgi:hypothetical protein
MPASPNWYQLPKDFAAPLLAALAFAAGLWQYAVSSQRDFIRPLREAQLTHYVAASGAASSIATLPRDSDAWKKSRDEFLRLFYGPLAIFENFDHKAAEGKLTVEMAMIIFKTCLDDLDRCEKDGGNLRDLSLALAHACRESLGKSWGYDLPQLRGDYQQRALDYWDHVHKPSP